MHLTHIKFAKTNPNLEIEHGIQFKHPIKKEFRLQSSLYLICMDSALLREFLVHIIT